MLPIIQPVIDLPEPPDIAQQHAAFVDYLLSLIEPEPEPPIKRTKAKEAKKESVCPLLRRKEVVGMLATRSVLEDAERAGWLKAAIRRPRLVLYNRQEVLACVYRLSQGEYPA